MSRAMKDSGVPWIGKIPSHWETDNIGSLYSQRNEKVSDKDYPPLSVSKMGVVPQLETAAKTDDGDNRKLVRKGDFAINSRSDRRGSCGISAYDGSVSLINTILTPRTEMNPRFYDWLFHTSVFADEFYKWGHGIVDDLWTTRWAEMKRISIVVPPIPEQQSIADFLDKKCGEIDEMVSLQEKIVEVLKAYKQSVITEAVCKGLNPDVPMKDSGIEWIGRIPERWEVKRLKYVGYGENGLTYSPADMCGEEGVLVLRSSNIQGSKLVFSDNVYVSCSIPEKLFVKKGDIIICSRNGSAALVGKCALVEDEINASFGAFMLRFRTTLYNRYAYYLLTGVISNYKQLFSTTTINQLTLSTLNNLYAPVATEYKEQKAIVDYLDTKCAEIDTLISVRQAKIDALKEYKKSIIYEYITGKKEVNG